MRGSGSRTPVWSSPICRRRGATRPDEDDDALIAMTARALGATVVTENGSDLELLRRIRRFELEVF
jgi:predicted nucleic acid-binding protein